MDSGALLDDARPRRDRLYWLDAAGRIAARRVSVELFGAPGYAWTLKRPRPSGFVVGPRDFRPSDTAAAKSIAAGRFAFAGAVQTVRPPADVWTRSHPSRAFAEALHRFDWLRSATAAGDGGAKLGLEMIRAWKATFGAWSEFSWSRDVAPRRVFNLACSVRALLAVCTAEDAAFLAETLAVQARHVLLLPDDRGWAAEHLTAAATAGAALADPAGAAILRRALRRLERALPRSVLPDGGHASRNPEAAMELLFDLLTLDDALAQRGVESPATVGRAVDRLTQALRFFTLPDGRLASFQGGEASSRTRVAAVRSHDDIEGEPPQHLPETGYHRLAGRSVLCVLDAGPPAAGVWSLSACAQPLAIEVVCGKDRLITNCGWSPRDPDRQGFRATAAGSTLSLGDASVLDPLQGRVAAVLGPRLHGDPVRVRARRSEAERAVFVEAAHDGWVRRFGLVHERRLYVDADADELRGEDRLDPAREVRPTALAAPYAVRFHLHPKVQVSLARDQRSVLLRGPGGVGWWFRNDAPDVAIEPSAWFDEGVARRSTQIVLRGVARTDAATRVRWKLTPATGSGEPAGL